MSADIAGVLAAHEDSIGWTYLGVGDDDLCYECGCGERSQVLTHDGQGVTEAGVEAAAAWHRTHVAEQITAHLRDVVLGAREAVADAVVRHQRIPTYKRDALGTPLNRCSGCDHLKGESDGANSPRHALHQVDAALAVVVGVLGGAE